MTCALVYNLISALCIHYEMLLAVCQILATPVRETEGQLTLRMSRLEFLELGFHGKWLVLCSGMCKGQLPA